MAKAQLKNCTNLQLARKCVVDLIAPFLCELFNRSFLPSTLPAARVGLYRTATEEFRYEHYRCSILLTNLKLIGGVEAP